MKCALFGFASPNLGDDVQALAAAVILPSIDAYVDRDRLDKVRLNGQYNLLMNSWFAIKRYEAVPTDSIIPHYFGQCIGRPELVNKAWLAEWKKHEPIGCRDLTSVALLRDHGINTHFTGCLTSWMGRFFQSPAKREGIVFLDVPADMERFIPDEIRSRAKRITNHIAKGNSDQRDRFRKCAEILDTLRTAEMVVTRRLHAALPCVGFKTPVTVYLEDNVKNRGRFSGSDRLLPIVYHKNGNPLNEAWQEPEAREIPADMDGHFQDLLGKLGACCQPKWSSVSDFVETLPVMAREPRSFLQRLRAA